ncbi:MAG: membrane protein insertase YidC [Gammaproteobacteria bacterium]|nr:MAG: membrane protein insertase YidC [Pseudomonadota bacterium]PIE38283.1 MAG: membrane protein insertase YidC [Gammaproteobacteria bacterium]
MDFQRGIIFAGLAIVSYLMILAWNNDYGQNPNTPVAATQNQTAQSSASPHSTPEINFDENRNQSDISNRQTVNDSEFITPESTQTPSVSATGQTASGKIITVKTDTYKIGIDLRGGNIISAALPHYKQTLHSKDPFYLLESSAVRKYIMESGFYGKNGFDSVKNGGPAIFTSESDQYTLSETENELIVDLVHHSKDGVKVTKRYTFYRDRYLINVDYILDNTSDQTWEGNFSGKIIRDNTGDPSQQNSMGMQSFLGMVLSSKEEPYEKISFDDLREESVNRKVSGGWVAFIQHYFITAWIPNPETTHYYQSKVRNNEYLMGFISPATVLQPGEQTTVSVKAYIGPKIIDRLKKAADKLDLTVDYGWLFFISYPLFLLLDFLYGFVGNWGVAIILVTVCVKAVFFHLSAASYRSMAAMRKVAPELTRLKEQYGDDRQKMSQAMMDLYRKEKINPLGGCLPILVQMPVFIALYWVLLESVQLRHAPFVFWITDLSVKDHYFILPLLMGATMFIQMALNPTPPDPIQAKVMKMMPVIFTIFFLWFPAGLVLYWLVNNILSISQQWYITRQIEKGA